MCDGILWPFAGYHKAATFFFIVFSAAYKSCESVYESTKRPSEEAGNYCGHTGLTDTLWQAMKTVSFALCSTCALIFLFPILIRVTNRLSELSYPTVWHETALSRNILLGITFSLRFLQLEQRICISAGSVWVSIVVLRFLLLPSLSTLHSPGGPWAKIKGRRYQYLKANKSRSATQTQKL